MRIKIFGGVACAVSLLATSGCGFSPYQLPLPGGADLGSEPYSVKIQFRDVLDLVPQSAVRVNDIAVGKVTDIDLEGWTAVVTVKVNRDAELPDNTVATIRQTSLLGEKFVSLAPPENGAVGSLGDGDKIPLDRSSRNPEIEEVLGAASLLFNGGGLEKTNTIVRELNDALDGNEPEIKQLLTTTSTFITQLDENKESLLTALEKVNRLAIATNDQTDAITGALDELPSALRVVNKQRDELVGLLESLDRLGDVATGVVRSAKADTVADLKALIPTLTNLAKAGDDLATGTQALLTFPFSDGFVGGSVAAASGRCQDSAPGRKEIKEGACFGDFANLSMSLDLGVEQLSNILGGFSLDDLTSPTTSADPGAEVPGAAPVPQADPSAIPGGDSISNLVDLVTGLIPGGREKPEPGSPGLELPGLELPGLGLPGLTGGGATPSAPPTAPGPAPTATPTKSGGFFCSLLGLCRAPVAGSAESGLSRLLIDPVVAP